MGNSRTLIKTHRIYWDISKTSMRQQWDSQHQARPNQAPQSPAQAHLDTARPSQAPAKHSQTAPGPASTSQAKQSHWSIGAGALELEHWSWNTGVGAVEERWRWSTGAGALALERWSWSDGAGALEMEPMILPTLATTRSPTKPRSCNMKLPTRWVTSCGLALGRSGLAWPGLVWPGLA